MKICGEHLLMPYLSKIKTIVLEGLPFLGEGPIPEAGKCHHIKQCHTKNPPDRFPLPRIPSAW